MPSTPPRSKVCASARRGLRRHHAGVARARRETQVAETACIRRRRCTRLWTRLRCRSRGLLSMSAVRRGRCRASARRSPRPSCRRVVRQPLGLLLRRAKLAAIRCIRACRCLRGTTRRARPGLRLGLLAHACAPGHACRIAASTTTPEDRARAARGDASDCASAFDAVDLPRASAHRGSVAILDVLQFVRRGADATSSRDRMLAPGAAGDPHRLDDGSGARITRASMCSRASAG